MSWLPKKTVVVPYDFSDHSGMALELARELVSDATHLHVVHVLSDILLAEPGFVLADRDRSVRQRHAEMAFRERFPHAPFHSVDFHVRFGDPGHEICNFAEEVLADLIVMSSHGRRGLPRILIGSVAERTVRLAHCPVLILK